VGSPQRLELPASLEARPEAPARRKARRGFGICDAQEGRPRERVLGEEEERKAAAPGGREAHGSRGAALQQ
jgi:hypothetical protein